VHAIQLSKIPLFQSASRCLREYNIPAASSRVKDFFARPAPSLIHWVRGWTARASRLGYYISPRPHCQGAAGKSSRAPTVATAMGRCGDDPAAGLHLHATSCYRFGNIFFTAHNAAGKEVYSDLTGERGVLMGALEGIIEAQYQVLRENGHSPSEAFNETVEELTQSLIRLVDEKGMDFMYVNCSATAQRGALDWKGPFREATLPVFKELYRKVSSGEECVRVLESTSATNYREVLETELKEMRESELWKTGAAVRKLRPNK